MSTTLTQATRCISCWSDIIFFGQESCHRRHVVEGVHRLLEYWFREVETKTPTGFHDCSRLYLVYLCSSGGDSTMMSFLLVLVVLDKSPRCQGITLGNVMVGLSPRRHTAASNMWMGLVTGWLHLAEGRMTRICSR